MSHRVLSAITLLVLLAAPTSLIAADEDEQWMEIASTLSKVNAATGAVNLVLVVAQRGNKIAGGVGIASGLVSLLYFSKVFFVERPDGDEDKVVALFATGAATLVLGMYSFKIGRDRSSRERAVSVSPIMRLPASDSPGYAGVMMRF